MCVCIYIYTYIYIYIYTHTHRNTHTHTHINCSVNMWLRVSEKSVFQISLGCDRFQGNLFSFEK